MNYKKVYVYNTLYDLYDKLVRVHLLMKHITLQEQQIRVLIYFTIYGINKISEEKILEDKVVKYKQQILNAKTVLKDNKLIIREKYNKWYICKELDQQLQGELTIAVKCIKKN